MNQQIELHAGSPLRQCLQRTPDVDLSVAAQLRALRDYAQKNGYLVAREYVDEAESGRIPTGPSSRICWMRPPSRGSLQGDSRLEVLKVHQEAEHAVAFKSMLRRKGIRVVSITEHADDSPTGKLMEAIIESVDEFYSENLAQEVVRGMREAASRGFWVASRVPYGYRKLMVQDGAKKAPRWNPIPPPRPWWSASSGWPRRAGESWTSPAPSTTRASPTPPAGSGQERRPHHPPKRGVYGRSGLGHDCEGQCGPGAGGEGLPLHHLQDPGSSG